MTAYKNTLLRHFDADVLKRLALYPVRFEFMHEMEFPGRLIDSLFFVEEGVASMTTTFRDGTQVEVGMFGYESVAGISALMGSLRSLNRVYTQIPGHGFACSLSNALAEFALHGSFHDLTLRYVQAQLLTGTQSIACNARHTVEQRLSRWLLICADRAHTLRLPLSQDLLSQMLGTTRPTVSVAAGLLKARGLIDYTRGIVEIRDLAGLQMASCECYAVVKNHLDNYAEFDNGFLQ